MASQKPSNLVFAEEKWPEGLLPTGAKILRHWKKHCPRMCRELEKEGKLLKVVGSVQNHLLDTMYDLEVLKKIPRNQVEELVRPMWCFPDESGEGE